MAVRRGGRRPGDSGTRDDILAAAARQFGELGYDRATLRSIAGEAGVDPKLIAHFFGNKQRLFVEAVGLPINPAEILPAMLAGERSTITGRIATVVEGVLSNPEANRKMVALVRAAASEPEVAAMLRQFLTSEVFLPASELLSLDQPLLRLNMAGSQLVGLVVARYIVGIEPLASAPPKLIASIVAETFRRYLLDPLPAPTG